MRTKTTRLDRIRFGLVCVIAASGDGAYAQNAPVPAPAPAAPASAPAAVQSLETVNVTASKRTERQQDAPTALTAIGAQKIENLDIKSFTDYASLVPNLTQTSGVAPGVGTVVIRGLYSGPQQTTNTTAFYLGESAFTSSGAFAVGSLVTPDLDLGDVARIEILKGPQGTLYGASALGGLVRVIPRLPDPSAQGIYGYARLGASQVSNGGSGYSTKLLLNVPVAPNTLAAQFSVFSREEGGFVKNTRTGHDELGRVHAEGGSLALVFTPARDLTFTLRGLTQKLHTNGPAQQDNVLGTGTPVTGERQFSSFFDPASSSQYGLLEATGEWRSPYGTLTAVASQGTYDVRLQSDYSVYSQLFQPTYCKTFPAACAPAPDYNGLANINPSLRKQSNEIRFASRRLGPVEFLAGLFQTEEHSRYFIDIQGVNSALAPAIAPFNNIIASTTQGVYREEAVFGNLTYYVTEQIDLTGGLRYAKNKQHFELGSSGLLGRPGQGIESSDDSTTYLATARWRPTRETSVFARVATGYRPGGPQNNPAAPNPTFEPDRVTNYELGLKGSTLSGRLSYDASIYHTDWKNIQLNALLNGVVFVGNAGKATIDGFEAQLGYSDPSGVDVGAAFGYNNAKLKDIGTTTAAFIGAAAGDSLPGTPKVTAALYADYALPLAAAWRPSIGATARYQGSRHASYSQPSVNPDYLIPAYTTIDLRATARWSRYTLRLGVDNVTDKKGVTAYGTVRVLATQTPPSTAYLIRPRTFTAMLGVDF